jgi:hypothetical protein
LVGDDETLDGLDDDEDVDDDIDEDDEQFDLSSLLSPIS